MVEIYSIPQRKNLLIRYFRKQWRLLEQFGLHARDKLRTQSNEWTQGKQQDLMSLQMSSRKWKGGINYAVEEDNI